MAGQLQKGIKEALRAANLCLCICACACVYVCVPESVCSLVREHVHAYLQRTLTGSARVSPSEARPAPA
jgi:hypothetical protein